MVKAKARHAKQQRNKRVPSQPLQYQVVSRLTDEQRVSAIVGQVLVHFGAGYGAQRQTEAPGAPPANQTIFRRPSDLATFHFMLMDSTVRNFGTINWDTNTPLRDQITRAAFKHGILARQRVVADGTVTLRIDQILASLRAVQLTDCPGSGGAGGGPVCDF